MTKPLKTAWILAVLAWVQARADGDLEMQVEEPAARAAPPINPDHEAGGWKPKAPRPGLSQAQKAALEERRKLVEAMTSEIREKREAVQNSTSEEREARIKDLEALILDQKLDKAKDAAKLEKLLEKQAEARAKGLGKKLETLENKLEKSIEKKQEKLDKEQKARDAKVNPGKAGK